MKRIAFVFVLLFVMSFSVSAEQTETEELYDRLLEANGGTQLHETLPDEVYELFKENGIENARFLCADAAKAAETLASEGLSPQVVILDPPRKGCSEDLIKTVAQKFAPKRVVYVSCDPATLARDIKIFGKLGYNLIEYTPCDLFPKTAHVETVALLCQTNDFK